MWSLCQLHSLLMQVVYLNAPPNVNECQLSGYDNTMYTDPCGCYVNMQCLTVASKA